MAKPGRTSGAIVRRQLWDSGLTVHSFTTTLSVMASPQTVPIRLIQRNVVGLWGKGNDVRPPKELFPRRPSHSDFGNNLETELGSLFSQAHFESFPNLLVAVVKYALSVGFSGG